MKKKVFKHNMKYGRTINSDGTAIPSACLQLLRANVWYIILYTPILCFFLSFSFWICWYWFYYLNTSIDSVSPVHPAILFF